MLFKPNANTRARMCAASILSLTSLAASQAIAHESPKGWAYPMFCCANDDCRRTTSGEVSERPEGYVIATGEVVAYSDKRIQNSPDGDYHWCAHQSGLDAGRTICLFVPSRSF